MNAWTAIKTRKPAHVSTSGGVESEDAHGQGSDGNGRKGEPEPDQAARPEASNNLGIDDR
jgi:hypothetical protein